MAEDALIAGAAAPAGTRRIRSAPVLDALWALLVAGLIVLSSFFPLLNFDNSLSRTGEAPLRVYALGLPVLALLVIIVAVVRRSAVSAAVASGLLVPAIALLGSLAGALFFDAVSPFTDAGTPLSLGCAIVGVVMLIRWFVYAPTPVAAVDARPTPMSARVLLGTGLVLVANVVIAAFGDDPQWSASFVVATMFMLLAPLVVVAAAVVRTVAGNALASGASAAQLVAVAVVLIDGDGIGVTSVFALRTGVVGMIGLAAAAVVAGVGAMTAGVESDAEVVVSADDDAAWRWHVDDEV
jgi:hypothetical protein